MSLGAHRTPGGSGRRPIPPPGAMLGPFQVLGGLGQGGMGAVLHVYDTVGQRELALKLLTSEQVSARSLERFQREGSLTASLQHPGIITVHDAGVIDGWPYIAYELVRGADLAHELQHLERERALQIVLQVSEALGHAHAQGVIHRDLKPSNILIGEDGRARVADFGLAQSAGLERLTLTGALVGTPTYMAPEQVGGERDAFGPHTDVWALGVLLYRVLLGQEPFVADGMLELAARIADTAPTPPRSSDASISVALEAVCLKALRKEPAERYPHASAFAQDLRHALNARHSQVEALAERNQKRHRRVVFAALSGAAILLAAAGLVRALAPEAQPVATEPPPIDREAAAAARAQERRRAALARALRLEQPADTIALARLSKTLSPAERAQVRAARAAAVEALAAHQPQRPCLTHTARLSALAQALSGDPPPEALNALALASIRPLIPRIGAEISLLDRWASTGARIVDRLAGLDLVDAVHAVGDNGRLPKPQYWHALVALIRLDVAFVNHTTAPVLGTRPPWAEQGASPFRRLLVLRARLPNGNRPSPEGQSKDSARRRELRALLREASSWLGPVHWAQSVLTAARDLPHDRQRGWFLEATQRDPLNARVLETLANLTLEAGEQEASLAYAVRAREAFERFKQHQRISTMWEQRFFVRAAVRALIALGRRDEARARYQELFAIGRGEAERVRKKHPWIDPAFKPPKGK